MWESSVATLFSYLLHFPKWLPDKRAVVFVLHANQCFSTCVAILSIQIIINEKEGKKWRFQPLPNTGIILFCIASDSFDFEGNCLYQGRVLLKFKPAFLSSRGLLPYSKSQCSVSFMLFCICYMLWPKILVLNCFLSIIVMISVCKNNICSVWSLVQGWLKWCLLN